MAVAAHLSSSTRPRQSFERNLIDLDIKVQSQVAESVGGAHDCHKRVIGGPDCFRSLSGPSILNFTAACFLVFCHQSPTMSLVAASLRVSRRSARPLVAQTPAKTFLQTRTRWQTRFINTQPAYEGHIPLNWFETGFLTLGSAFMSLANPRRAGEPSWMSQQSGRA